MTQQYRITTQNLFYSSDDDCELPADDPVHQLKIAGILGGLGSQARLAEYNSITQQRIRDKIDRTFKEEFGMTRDEAIAAGYRPGTPAWNALFQLRG